MDLDVTSVSKRAQKVRDVATSIYVITQDDIRRSGATRIQDALKLAPGVWVDEASYTITGEGIRNSAFAFSSSLLWILDGVPMTDPIIGGVFFNALDLPLEDIDRIEIIKGPGGSIYGANAATGIVSIFTKSGEASEGLKASLSGGTQNYLAPYFRYGFEARPDFFVTVWARLKTHDGYRRNPLFAGDSLWAPINGSGDVRTANQFRGVDDYQRAQSGGLKWDYQPGEKWKWSGQIRDMHVNDGQYSIQLTPYPDSAPATPGVVKAPDSVYANREAMDQLVIQTRFDGSLGTDNNYFLSTYHWRYRYDVALASGFLAGFDITEVEAQDNLKYGRHNVSAGANFRRVQYEFRDLRATGSIIVQEPDYLAFLAGAFLQDEMEFGPRWRLTAGAKAETWTPLGWVPEISPSLRLAFKPNNDQTWWAAASRGVTTPANSQRDMEVRVSQLPPTWQKWVWGAQPPPGAGKWVALVSGDEVPVNYYTLECGQRGSWKQRVQWDVSGFYSWVRGQIGLTPVDPTFQTVIASKGNPSDSLVPLYNANLDDEETFGGEAWLRLLPMEALRMEFSYSLFWVYNFVGYPIPNDPGGRTFPRPDEFNRQTPNHVLRARANCVLPFETGLNVNGIVSSPFSRGEAFNYALQRPVSQTGRFFANQAVIADAPRWQFQMDVSLEKKFLADRLTVTAWGRNLLADPFVEVFNQYGWISYPHQIYRTFGINLSYQP